jgi:hypothetical protein
VHSGEFIWPSACVSSSSAFTILWACQASRLKRIRESPSCSSLQACDIIANGPESFYRHTVGIGCLFFHNKHPHRILHSSRVHPGRGVRHIAGGIFVPRYCRMAGCFPPHGAHQFRAWAAGLHLWHGPLLSQGRSETRVSLHLACCMGFFLAFKVCRCTWLHFLILRVGFVRDVLSNGFPKCLLVGV